MSTEHPTRKVFGRAYLVRNTVNNKIYVGQTVRPLEKRWKHHVYRAWHAKHDWSLCRAIRKYGADAFTITLLQEADSQEELDQLEVRFIAQYDAFNNKVGYNLRSGKARGELAQESVEKIRKGLTGKKHSEETKAKMRAWHQSEEGKRVALEARQKQPGSIPEEVRRKISEAMKGRPLHPDVIAAARRHNIGRPKSEEHRRKLSESLIGNTSWNKGKPLSEEHRAALSKAWERRKAKSGDNVFSQETRQKLSDSATKDWARREQKKIVSQN